MERRQQVRQDSVAQYILEHLFHTGSVFHKEIVLIFDRNRHKQTIWKAIRDLEEIKFIEVKKSNSKDGRKISLTAKGFSALQNLDDYYSLYEYLKIPRWSIKDTKGEKESQIKTMIVGTDILCYPRYKPDLFTAAQIINDRVIQEGIKVVAGYWISEEISEFAERFGKGIYYSPAEVRNALKVDIGAEQTYTSRFNGIIITPDKIYILYHVQDGLIKINKPSESTLIDALQTLFYNYPQYLNPSCITFGTSPFDIAIPTLVTGFKGGVIVNKESLHNLNAQEAMNFLKANSKLFGEIFYIPVNEIGIELLDNIISTTTEERRREIDEWFESMGSYLCQKDTHTGIFIEKQCAVEHIAYTELKKILEIRKSQNSVRIVTNPIFAEGIAQAVGPNAIDFVDFEGKEIITNKYDIYGFKLGHTIVESQEIKEIKEAITQAVFCRIPLQLYYLLETDADKDNISVQKKIIKIIDEYYSQ